MSKCRKLPSPRVLRRLIDYNARTGELKWKMRPAWLFAGNNIGGKAGQAKAWNGRWAGQRAFKQVHKTGYLTGVLWSFSFLAHRVAWAVHTGEWPDGDIDHINGDRADNRFSNLRCVTSLQNAKNQKLPKSNTSGHIGVSWIRHHKAWVASICVNRKKMTIGYFKKIEDAIAARKAAEQKFGFHPNHGRTNQGDLGVQR